MCPSWTQLWWKSLTGRVSQPPDDLWPTFGNTCTAESSAGDRLTKTSQTLRPLLDAQLNAARWRLTWFGFKGDWFAADAVALMGVNPQMVLGARHQLRHRDGRLLYHSLNFHRPVALETRESGQLHSGWGCGLLTTGQQVVAKVTEVQFLSVHFAVRYCWVDSTLKVHFKVM